MITVAWVLAADRSAVDRRLMESLLLLSSSEPARVAAAHWLASFDAARALGATVEEAAVTASRASPSPSPAQSPGSVAEPECEQVTG
jgi:hypothetical protein